MVIPSKVKGDSFQITVTVGEDITDWKIRCEIFDAANKIRLATANVSGGSDSQIKIIMALEGRFTITVDKGLTTDFDDRANIEVEVETDDSPSKKYTIIQEELRFKDARIDWDAPSE